MNPVTVITCVFASAAIAIELRDALRPIPRPAHLFDLTWGLVWGVWSVWDITEGKPFGVLLGIGTVLMIFNWFRGRPPRPPKRRPAAVNRVINLGHRLGVGAAP